MKEIKTVITTQVRIFPPDRIPLTKVAIPEYGQQIQALFAFASVSPVQQEGALPGIAFTGGLYKPDSTVIESVSIEPRRIIIKVHGSSSTAQSVFDVIRKKLEEFAGKSSSIEEVICTHETSSSVVLDFGFDRLLSEKFKSFLTGPATLYTKITWSDNLIVPLQLSFSVRYKITDDALIKRSIGFSNKTLRIEPRGQSSADDRLFWIESPTDTDTHFKLIEELEKTLR